MSLAAKEEYFDEPTCEHNGVTKEKKDCKTATLNPAGI